MGSGPLSVAKFTLLELGRRRLLLVFVVLAILLTAGLGVAPFILPGFNSGDEKTVFILGGISRVDGLAIELCAFAVGMTVINHDLDSGAIVAILAKPVTRVAYALGKLAAAVFLLILLDAVFTAGSILVVEFNGGGHMDVMFWFFAVSAGNAMLLMVLVMILTVYLNNIIAAAIVVAFSFVQSQVSSVQAMVQNHLITERILDGIVNVVYWLVPHPLQSNLERDITISDFNVICRGGCPDLPHPSQYLAQELAHIPGASGTGDIVYWFAYLVVVCVALYLALRRKQV